MTEVEVEVEVDTDTDTIDESNEWDFFPTNHGKRLSRHLVESARRLQVKSSLRGDS